MEKTKRVHTVSEEIHLRRGQSCEIQSIGAKLSLTKRKGISSSGKGIKEVKMGIEGDPFAHKGTWFWEFSVEQTVKFPWPEIRVSIWKET